MDAENGAVAKPIDIYARVSRLKRDEKREPSTEGQVAVCRGRLVDLGLTEGKVLIDPGRSAWNPNVKREAWDELMDRLERGISGGAIMFDLERLTRQPKDGERVIDLAAQGLLILDSESEYDLRTPNGKKAFRDAINAAAYYSDRLSTRSARGKKLKAMTGEPNGSARPFGFEADRVTQRDDEAAIVRDLTRRFLAGETQDALVDDLNARGVLTSYGNRWTQPQLGSSSPGNATAAGSCTPTRRRMSPRSSATCRVSRSSRKKTLNVYARCSPPAVVAARTRPSTSARHRRMRDAGLRQALAWSPAGEHEAIRRRVGAPPLLVRPRTHGGCLRIAVDQRGLDEAAAALAIEILADPRHADAIEATARELESEATRLDTAIAEAESVAEALADRLGRGEITLTRYDIAVRPLDERIVKLKAERNALGELISAAAAASES